MIYFFIYSLKVLYLILFNDTMFSIKNKVMIMEEIKINGLRFEYERERDLFNYLLKINGVSKKKFCEKFGLSYSYVNAWGSTTKEKDIKFPSWVLIYLKDVMYYKVEAIRIKMSLSRIYDELESGKNLTDIFKELNKSKVSTDGAIDMYIPDDIVASENSRVIRIQKGK